MGRLLAVVGDAVHGEAADDAVTEEEVARWDRDGHAAPAQERAAEHLPPPAIELEAVAVVALAAEIGEGPNARRVKDPRRRR